MVAFVSDNIKRCDDVTGDIVGDGEFIRPDAHLGRVGDAEEKSYDEDEDENRQGVIWGVMLAHGRVTYQSEPTVKPPSTTKTAPVVKSEPDDAR